MNETTTHYRVRNDAGLIGTYDEVGLPVDALLLTSRIEAERVAAEHGGWVEEVVTTTRRVGLRWKEHGSDWLLRDGEQTVACVLTEWVAAVDKDGTASEPWLSSVAWGLSGRRGIHRSTDVTESPDAAIDAAKSAAEAAVREGWS